MATEIGGMTEGEQIALRIREVRKVSGKSQVEFAKAIGVSRSYLSEVEARKSKPSIEMIVGVATHFPELASPYWLLLGYGTIGHHAGAAVSDQPVDWQAMLYACELKGKMALPPQPQEQAIEVEAKVLTILVNAYASAYRMSTEAGDTENEARRWAEYRARRLAGAMGDDMDLLLARGPAMPL